MISKYEIKHGVTGKDGKTYWTKCGVLLPAKDGKEGFSLSLDYIPTSIDPSKGLWLRAFPPETRSQNGGREFQRGGRNDHINEMDPF